MAEADRNAQYEDALMLIPKVREQTQKHMQPNGDLNTELSSKAFKFCSMPSLAYQQAVGSSVKQLLHV